MQVLPELNERQQRILEVYDRVEKLYHKLISKRDRLRDWRQAAMLHGFYNILLGKFAPDLTEEEARRMIQLAHNVCREEGLDPSTMFAGEIVDVVFEVDRCDSQRVTRPFHKAVDKVRQTALKAEISALKVQTFLIGNKFVSAFTHDMERCLFFTDKDKQLLFDTKHQVVTSLVEAVEQLGEATWLKGYEREAEPCSLAEFLECARISTWIEIQDVSVTYYTQSRLKPNEFVVCNETPQPGDDTRSVQIDLYLYSGFEQDSDEGYPLSALSFSIVSDSSY